jgi:hypothetical protein
VAPLASTSDGIVHDAQSEIVFRNNDLLQSVAFDKVQLRSEYSRASL